VRILVAETNLLLLHDMKQALEQIGHEVIVMNDGMKAWVYLTGSTPPDLLVTCIDIGPGTPPGTALGMHARSRQPRIPVIYTPSRIDLAEYADPEHGAVLVKPFAIQDLVEAARHLLGQVIPAAVDDDSTGVSGGWYRAPAWRASEHASEGAARRMRLLPTEADPFFMGQLQGRLVLYQPPLP
jgi:DNA-binding response OmpR family regulator